MVALGLGNLSQVLLAWVDLPDCFGLVDLQAGVLLAQLQQVLGLTSCPAVVELNWFQKSEQMVP